MHFTGNLVAIRQNSSIVHLKCIVWHPHCWIFPHAHTAVASNKSSSAISVYDLFGMGPGNAEGSPCYPAR